MQAKRCTLRTSFVRSASATLSCMRIPFAETRNYVLRVMENLQAYRARFDANTAAPNLHPAASVELRDKPTLVDSIPH
jgi:hypothetical protein